MFTGANSLFCRLGLGVVWVATLAIPNWAQNGVAPQPAIVQNVLVREVGGSIVVEIQTSDGPVSPNTQAITGPDRIVIDFPGATPSSALRTLKVNRSGLKGVRAGLFFSNPPIARIVLDLTGPQPYQISNSGNMTVVKLTRAAAPEKAEDAGKKQGARLMDAAMGSRAAHLNAASEVVASTGRPWSPHLAPPANSLELGAEASPLKPKEGVNGVPASPQLMRPADAPVPAQSEPVPPEPQPSVSVTYENGMLSIRADRATLSQVLYEVHLRTQAEIAIPAGAEQEKVIAELGPAPVRSVLAELLNGSAYNFIFVGNDEASVQRVILTRREGSF